MIALTAPYQAGASPLMSDHTSFGARLRALRRELGISQVELGKLIGKDQTTVSKVEVGTAAPGDELVEAVIGLAGRDREAWLQAAVEVRDRLRGAPTSTGGKTFLFHSTPRQLQETLRLLKTDLMAMTPLEFEIKHAPALADLSGPVTLSPDEDFPPLQVARRTVW